MSINNLLKLSKYLEFKYFKIASVDYSTRTIVSNTSQLTKESLIEYYNQNISRKHHPLVNKPTGIWYGFGLSWANSPLSNGRYLYSIDIDDSNILNIDENNIISFINTFVDLPKTTARNNSSGIFIDWQRVSTQYSGVEIRNLYDLKDSIKSLPRWQWSFNNNTADFPNWDINFVESWDVSSGCLWNPSILNNINNIGELHLDEQAL